MQSVEEQITKRGIITKEVRDKEVNNNYGGELFRKDSKSHKGRQHEQRKAARKGSMVAKLERISRRRNKQEL